MKITTAKDYKTPVYAIGVAATVMTLAVSGCTAPASKSKDKTKNTTDYFYMDMLGGKVQVGEPEDVVLAGDTQVVDYAGEETIVDTTETDVRLSGGAPIDE